VTASRRLSICYAAPGQNLLPSAGPTRNVLSVAEALSEWADVTVAFRRVLVPAVSSSYRVMQIDPGPPQTSSHKDDNATRGLRPIDHLAYCRTVWSFGKRHAKSFDVVLEKGWRLSGLLSAAFRSGGVPGIVVENDARFWTEPVTGLTSLSKYALHRGAQCVAAYCSRRAPIIAETEELKATLVAHRGITPEEIHVVGLGVDHSRFRPQDQSAARASFGIDPGAVVLLYVGAMDEYHDLEPVISAFARLHPAAQLHLVGDGEFRPRYEALATVAGITCRFHGQVPHQTVPQYIAAADLCLAPYRTSAFHGGVVTFSTLKIPEYMACGRPAISVPSPGIRRLVEHGVDGFLFPNEEPAWLQFFRSLPSRRRLAIMGKAAAQAVAEITWDKTASRYFEMCETLVAPHQLFDRVPVSSSCQAG